jgi:hypothetical protein
MKRFLLTLVTCTGLILCIQPLAAKSAYTAKATKKSSVRGSNDGKYVGGKGSSHKGGTYKNSKTGNHERNRKAGVPK